jgi:hypothetical protein
MQEVPSGHAPLQTGTCVLSQGGSSGRQKHGVPGTPVTQTSPAGHAPPHSGCGDCAHGMGPGLHVHTPEVSGTQSHPVGQPSPLHVGNGAF